MKRGIAVLVSFSNNTKSEVFHFCTINECKAFLRKKGVTFSNSIFSNFDDDDIISFSLTHGEYSVEKELAQYGSKKTKKRDC